MIRISLCVNYQDQRVKSFPLVDSSRCIYEKRIFFPWLEGHSFKGSLIGRGRLLLIVQSNSIFVHSQGDGDVDLQLDCFPFDRSHAWASPRNEFFYEEGNINV